MVSFRNLTVIIIYNIISDSDQKRNIPGLHPRIRYQCNEFLTINHLGIIDYDEYIDIDRYYVSEYI